MEVSVNTRELEQLADGLGRLSQNIPTQEVNRILRKSVRPVLNRLKREVPVSREGEYIPLSKKGLSANAYRRGGATRKDLRIKTVPGRGREIGRVAVGVSKARGKVGWRTGFTTGGTKPRYTKKGAFRGSVRGNDFLTRAYSAEIEGVRDSFSKDFKDHFDGWARKHLPQNYK